ncbi:MAG: AarF/ABC1/UbiB kinase family protein [Pseudomonadota bacterium]|nr:AarF/ABC1/UbiB kinase family protein [Pseudomonadota bacterium]
MSDRVSTPSRRFMKLAGMTASIAGKAMSNSIKSINATDAEKEAQRRALFETIGTQIADTLGEMKGAAMKVGQIASQYQDIFPPEIAQAMTKLQREAPAAPFSSIQKQLERELGRPLDQIFRSIEEMPFAAASIGQVHRAVLPDGQAVVVKVQYAGVDESCDSDLKQIRLALKLAGVLKIDKKLQEELFNEIRDSLHAELDYTREAHSLQVFAAFHANLDRKLIIPKVYPEYSTRRVLTLSEEMGDSIQTAATWSREIRNEIGNRLFDMMSQQIFYLNSFHCDPHPGNFAFRPDGSVVVYDFGCIKELNLDTVRTYKSLFNAAQQRNVADLERELRTLRVRNQKGQIPAEFYLEWIDILLPPLEREFNFGESKVHHQTVEKARHSLKYWDSFQPSAETMMINRAISGHYWNMVSLKVEDNFKPKLDRMITV